MKSVPNKIAKAIAQAAEEGRIRSTGVNVEALLGGNRCHSALSDVFPDALPDAPEADFHKIVGRLAAANGWEAAHCRKVLVKTGDDKFHYETPMAPGWVDWTFAKPGRLAFVELKVEPNTRDAEQVKWGDLLSSIPGVDYFVWYPRHWTFIKSYLKGELTC